MQCFARNVTDLFQPKAKSSDSKQNITKCLQFNYNVFIPVDTTKKLWYHAYQRGGKPLIKTKTNQFIFETRQ